MVFETLQNKENNTLNVSSDKTKLSRANEETVNKYLWWIWDWVVTNANPNNWWIEDYTDKRDFNVAYSAARKAWEKEFMWNGKRYTTNMKWSPAEQIKWSGITNDRLGIQGSMERRAYKTIKPSIYDDDKIGWQIKNFINNRNRFDNSEYSKISKQLADADKKGDSKEVKRLLDLLDNYSNDYFGEDDPYSEDAWRIYLWIPQKNNSFSIGKYKPTKSVDKGICYYALPEFFKDELYDLYVNKDIKSGLNSEFSFGRGFFGQNLSQARVLGNFTVNEWMDDRGNYISYYDIYDLSPKIPYLGKTETSKFVGNPFEIYDRIYYKNYSDWINKRMYYNDKELSELDVNEKNFDTLALQRELSNRWYKFPKSTKNNGNLDWIFGDETKAALLDQQKKNWDKKIFSKKIKLN